MATAPKAVAADEPVIHYPESDGKPLGESEWHIDALVLLRDTLKYHFRRRPVHIAFDLFLYYEKGNPRAVKAPDTMVLKDIGKHRRRTFKTWEEKAVPCVILEITSESRVTEDMREKKELYARLGVREHFVFDPDRSCLDPPLRGFRLRGKKYVPLVPEPDGSLTSQELGLRLLPGEDRLRLFDARTGRRLLSPAERAEQERRRAEQERQRAKQERQRADALAAEVERLRAELDVARRKPE
jgi:Uma2 family endonuclease